MNIVEEYKYTELYKLNVGDFFTYAGVRYQKTDYTNLCGKIGCVNDYGKMCFLRCNTQARISANDLCKDVIENIDDGELFIAENGARWIKTSYTHDKGFVCVEVISGNLSCFEIGTQVKKVIDSKIVLGKIYD